MSNLRLISETSATSVSTLELQDVFTDDFDIYKFYTYYQSSAEEEQDIRLLNSSGSAITSDYDYAMLVTQSATSFSELRATNQTFFRVINKNENNYGGVAIGYIFNPTSTSSYTFLMSQCSHNYDLGGTSNVYEGFKNIGVLKQTTKVTGLQLINNTTADCELKVYGLRVDT